MKRQPLSKRKTKTARNPWSSARRVGLADEKRRKKNRGKTLVRRRLYVGRPNDDDDDDDKFCKNETKLALKRNWNFWTKTRS